MCEPTEAETTTTADEEPVELPAATDYDAVDDSSAASFPASDPPSWWSG